MSKGTGRQRVGRPPLPVGEGKRSAVGIRTTKDLRDRLAAASEASGRSIAQEIEVRLERSFEDPLGDPRSAAVFKALGDIARQVAVVRPQHWLDDYEAFQSIVERWANYLDGISPEVPQGIIVYLEQVFHHIYEEAEAKNIERAKELARLIRLGPFPAKLKTAYLWRVADATGIPFGELNAAPSGHEGSFWASGHPSQKTPD